MVDGGLLPVAVLACIAFGTGDMFGACASRRLSTQTAVGVSQISAVVFLYAFLLQPASTDLGAVAALLAIASGAVYALALLLLYHGLAFARVTIVAPLCAMSSIIIPLLGDIFLGRHVSSAQFAGIALCALAILPITGAILGERQSRTLRWSILTGVLSGLAYGSTDVILANMPIDQASAAVFVSRCATVAFALAIATVVTLRPVRATAIEAGVAAVAANPVWSGRGWVAPGWLFHPGYAFAMAAGMFDVLGQVGYVYAASRGSMGVASAVTALFPAVTVLLAVIFFGERISALQLVGYAFAAAGVVLLAA